MQGALHKCFYEIGPVRIYKFLHKVFQAMDKMDKIGEILFNGNMRLELKLKSKEDPNAFV